MNKIWNESIINYNGFVPKNHYIDSFEVERRGRQTINDVNCNSSSLWSQRSLIYRKRRKRNYFPKLYSIFFEKKCHLYERKLTVFLPKRGIRVKEEGEKIFDMVAFWFFLSSCKIEERIENCFKCNLH